MQVLGVQTDAAEGNGEEGDLLLDHLLGQVGACRDINRSGNALAVAEVDDRPLPAFLRLKGLQRRGEALLQVNGTQRHFLGQLREGLLERLVRPVLVGDVGLEAARDVGGA